MTTTGYDFDRVMDRRQTESIKWKMYNPDVLPMWVADMDFSAPPPVVDAIQRRAQHGVFGYVALYASLTSTSFDRSRMMNE